MILQIANILMSGGGTVKNDSCSKALLLTPLVLVLLLTTSCVNSYKYSQTSRLLDSSRTATSSYGKVAAALQVLDIDMDNAEARKIIIAELDNSIAETKGLVESPAPVGITLATYISSLDSIAKFQSDLIRLNFISSKYIGIDTYRGKSDAIVAEKIIVAVMADLTANDLDSAVANLENFFKCNLANTDKYESVLGTLQSKLIELGNVDKLLFVAKKIPYFRNEKVLSILLRQAQESEKSGNKRQALYLYSGMSEFTNNAVYSKKIQKLRNELVTLVVVSLPENNTDEFIPSIDATFNAPIVDAITDTVKLVEVVTNDSGLKEMQSNGEVYLNIKKNKVVNAKFENKVRYIVASRITSIKVFREQPNRQPKTMTDSPQSFAESMRAGIGQYQSYGGATITHYEYDEYTESVNAKVVFDLLVFDALQKKIVFEDRFEKSFSESSTWAANPMAVGIRNKVPAGYMPAQLSSLLSRQRKSYTDNEVKVKLLEACRLALIEKVKPVF